MTPKLTKQGIRDLNHGVSLRKLVPADTTAQVEAQALAAIAPTTIELAVPDGAGVAAAASIAP